MPDAELRFLVTHLFADTEGRASARRIDRLVGRLPGLEGLHLADDAVVDLARLPRTARAGDDSIERSMVRTDKKRSNVMLAEIFGLDGVVVLVVVVAVLFGGTQIPKLARSLGSARSEFKKGLADVQDSSVDSDAGAAAQSG